MLALILLPLLLPSCALASPAWRAAPVAPSTTHTAVLALPQRNLARLRRTLDAVSDPAHAEYGRYLSFEAVGEMGIYSLIILVYLLVLALFSSLSLFSLSPRASFCPPVLSCSFAFVLYFSLRPRPSFPATAVGTKGGQSNRQGR